MTLTEIQTAINARSLDEIKELRAYLEQREADLRPGRGKTPEERIRLLHKATAAIREGMTQAQLDQLTMDMNGKAKTQNKLYIFPVNKRLIENTY